MTKFRIFLTFFVSLILVSLILIQPAFARSGATDDQYAVPLAASEVDILFSDLTSNDTILWSLPTLVRAPLFGDLIPEGDRFRYVPRDEFWSVQLDSFVYGYDLHGSNHEAVVALYAAPYGQSIVIEQRFEDPAFLTDPNDEFDVYFSGGGSEVSFDVGAQLEGNTGILFETAAGMPSYITKQGSNGAGTGTGGGVHAGMGCIPNQDPGGGGLQKDLMLLAIGGDPHNPAIPPVLRLVTVGVNTVALEAWNGTYWVSTEKLPLPGDRAFIEIDWQPATTTTLDVMLRVDGRAAKIPGTIPNVLVDPAVHLGLMPLAGTPEVQLGWDHLRIFSSTSTLQITPIHSFHTFENGNMDDWDAMVGHGLSTNPLAAASGFYGLEADATEPSYLFSGAPKKSSEFVVQMRFDLSQYLTTSGDVSTIYSFGKEPAASIFDTRLRLRLYADQDHQPRLLTTFKQTTQGSAWSPTRLLDPGPVQLTLQYRAATSDENHNGYARVWINGTELYELDDLDSIGQEAAWSHFGLYGTDAGTSGYVLFDEFISAGR